MGTTESTYAASALSHVAAAAAPQVYERAVTPGSVRGEVCPQMGGRGFRAFTRHGSDLSAQYGSTDRVSSPQAGNTIRDRAEIGVFSVMSNGSLGKPGDGYRVISGAG